MEFAKKLFLWACVGVGVSIAAVAWRPIAGETTWTAEIVNGELVLVAVTLIASAIGYAAIASVSGATDVVKYIVIGLGLIALIMSIGVYADMSDRTPQETIDVQKAAIESYVILATSIFLGSLSTYVTHRSA